jgi:DNA polymerase III epsilon subunit-like protein
MIALDIETSGLNPEQHGIWQIGAIDLTNPENYFLEECRIDKDDEISGEALEVGGITEEQLRNNSKQSQEQLLINFFVWIEKSDFKNCICQNPQFDLGFISLKARKYGLKPKFHHRAFDMHSIAQTKYFEVKKSFLILDGISKMNFANVLEFCGLKDNRGAHNALEDCKLTGECFSRIFYSKSLFPEYSEFKIPDYLKK